MRNAILGLVIMALQVSATSANANEEPSFIRFEDCFIETVVYLGVVTTLRDRGDDIPFSELERSNLLMEKLIRYGARKYGYEKTMNVVKLAGQPIGTKRANAAGVLIREQGVTTGLDKLERRFRECESIWENEI